jgi:hypothetical protein
VMAASQCSLRGKLVVPLRIWRQSQMPYMPAMPGFERFLRQASPSKPLRESDDQKTVPQEERLLGLLLVMVLVATVAWANLSPQQQRAMTGGAAGVAGGAVPGAVTGGSPDTGASLGAQQARQRGTSGIACSGRSYERCRMAPAEGQTCYVHSCSSS